MMAATLRSIEQLLGLHTQTPSSELRPHHEPASRDSAQYVQLRHRQARMSSQPMRLDIFLPTYRAQVLRKVKVLRHWSLACPCSSALTSGFNMSDGAKLVALEYPQGSVSRPRQWSQLLPSTESPSPESSRPHAPRCRRRYFDVVHMDPSIVRGGHAERVCQP